MGLKKDAHIDWFEYNIPWYELPHAIDFQEIRNGGDVALSRIVAGVVDDMRSIMTNVDWNITKPPRSIWKAAYELQPHGAQVFISSPKSDTGVQVQLTGAHCNQGVIDSLEELRERLDGNYSRIDVAFNVYGAGYEQFSKWFALAMKKELTPLTKNQIGYGNELDGRTIYLGSLKSDVFIRIYEKGKQTGANESWLRAEVVLRGRRLRKLMSGRKLTGVIQVGYSELLRIAGDEVAQWFKPASLKLQDKKIKLETEESNMSEKWIYEVALKAVMKQMRKDAILAYELMREIRAIYPEAEPGVKAALTAAGLFGDEQLDFLHEFDKDEETK